MLTLNKYIVTNEDGTQQSLVYAINEKAALKRIENIIIYNIIGLNRNKIPYN